MASTHWTALAIGICVTLALIFLTGSGGPGPTTGANGMAPRPNGLRSCGSLKRRGERYVLLQDVSSAGTCFSIEAEKITLDLNGHTITYGHNSQGLARFGISGIACWDPDLQPGKIAERNPCAEDSGHFTVFGGTITQADSAAAFSHGIRLGQTRNGDYLTVHDMAFNLSARSSIPIYTTFTGAGSMIYNNVFYNKVTAIDNRHQEQGQSIKFNNTARVSPGQEIYGNTIIGGPQGGILTESPGAAVHDNSIAQDGRYTNDFAINLWGSNQVAYNNTVNVTSGRGIFIDGIMGTTTGASAHHNNVTVTEARQNREYGGCQLGGAYGIQFDDGGSGTVHHNRVLAKADQCEAKGLRLTKVGSGSSSHENVFTARRIGGTSEVAAGFSTGGGQGFSSWGDTFVSDTYNVQLDWDGGKNLIFQNDTLVKGDNPAPNYVTFSFRNSAKTAVTGVRFIDCIFLNGASADSTDMKEASAINWPGPSEYFIDWTLTLSVTDNQERSTPGATVVISDALGHLAFGGKTDAAGTFTAVLTEFRRFNTTEGVTKEMHTPHNVTISHEGCAPRTVSLLITGTTKHSVKLSCPE